MDYIKLSSLQNLKERSGNSDIDYSKFLDTYNLVYSEVDNYWLVGEPEQSQGWILHLSIIRTQIEQLLTTIIPELISANSSFKIIKNNHIAKLLLDGNLGYTKIGKIVSIYPKTNKEAVQLAIKLISLTKKFRGPVIPTDKSLGSIVYCRYGSFNSTTISENSSSKVRYIYNSKNELVEDVYSVPFLMPKGVQWPFGDITSAKGNVQPKLLNKKYKPLKIIKNDAKGNVIRGIYFKNLLNISKCIIKEGKRDMWVDEQERDMQERILWQFELSSDLKHDIPMPKMLDLFSETESTYIAMEYIKGQPLEDIIISTHSDEAWFNLVSTQKIKLVNYLIRIAYITKKLHSKGYVHRDITPNNFLITKRDKIYLIDMELAYSVINQKPSPAFKLGTIGYISPEQFSQAIPTSAEDIYALGCLMTFTFTGLTPVKFDITSKLLEHNLNHFIRNESISQLLANCLDRNSQKRPSIENIIEKLEFYKKSIEQTEGSKLMLEDNILANSDYATSENMIRNAIKGLAHPAVLSVENIWDSLILKPDQYIGTEQMERTHLCGIHSGMSGIMYLLSKAHGLKYDIKDCLTSYYSCWEYIQKNHLRSDTLENFGLYEGRAGIAIMISAGMEVGLLQLTDINISYLYACFENKVDSLTIANGVSGQGIAMLQCEKWLPHSMVSSSLMEYVEIILKQQLPDGSWNINHRSGVKNETVLGFSHGISGVIYFLLEYHTRYSNERLSISIKKALRWLTKQGDKNKKSYLWGITTKDKTINYLSFDIGITGIILLYIKAYKDFLKDPQFKEIAEGTLLSIPFEISNVDFTHSIGLSGLGEVYLEAYKTFENEEWNRRAKWIEGIFQHTNLVHKNGSVYWSMNALPDAVANLFNGCSGIIYFLMRCHNLDSLRFPIMAG